MEKKIVVKFEIDFKSKQNLFIKNKEKKIVYEKRKRCF